MNIDVIDLNFMGLAHAVAAYLVTGPSGRFLIECGPSPTRPRLLAELQRLGVTPGDLEALLVSHIHLDHAGDAGWWAEQGLKVLVHPQGLPHLVDPSKLVASATRIYGDMMDTLWGHVTPCPAERVEGLQDNQEVMVGGLPVRALDTPGHARHHLAFAIGDTLFTGDVGGVRLPGYEYIAVPAPPPEFDLEAWQASLRRLQGEGFARLYPTHFGLVEPTGDHFARLSERLEAATAFVGERRHLEREELVGEYYAWTAAESGLSEAQLAPYEKANPLFMSVDGILRYWKKRSS